MLADLLAIDLDGTLLTGDRTPHPDSARAIVRARRAGMQVVLASGRIRPSMLQFAEPLEVVNPMICANGGHLIAPEGDDAVVHHLDQASLDTVLEYSEAHQIHISIYTRDRLYFLRDTDWGEAYSRRVRSVRPITMPPDEVRRQPVLKLLLMDHPDRIPGHIQAMAPRIDPNRCRMTESEPEYLEFMPSHVSKGAALASLAGNLGIPQNRVAAVGDYLNDLEMLTFAGHSAAMSNGAEATKLAADRVVRSNDEGGVAEFIDILLAG